MRPFIFVCCVLSFTVLHAEDKPRFRTDADGPVKATEKRVNPKDRKPDGKPDWKTVVLVNIHPPIALPYHLRRG